MSKRARESYVDVDAPAAKRARGSAVFSLEMVISTDGPNKYLLSLLDPMSQRAFALVCKSSVACLSASRTPFPCSIPRQFQSMPSAILDYLQIVETRRTVFMGLAVMYDHRGALRMCMVGRGIIDDWVALLGVIAKHNALGCLQYFMDTYAYSLSASKKSLTSSVSACTDAAFRVMLGAPLMVEELAKALLHSARWDLLISLVRRPIPAVMIHARLFAELHKYLALVKNRILDGHKKHCAALDTALTTYVTTGNAENLLRGLDEWPIGVMWLY